MMMPPTMANLRFIAGCATADEALAVADAAGRRRASSRRSAAAPTAG